MGQEIIFVVEPDKSGGWQAFSDQEGILTHADTVDELKELVREMLDKLYQTDCTPVSTRFVLASEAPKAITKS